jgi:hypothetical protein
MAGYIQRLGDSDTSGRYDHFLINMFGGFAASYNTSWKSKLPSISDDSKTGAFVNQAGRDFGELLYSAGAYMPGGRSINTFVHGILCTNPSCMYSLSGPLTDADAAALGIP